MEQALCTPFTLSLGESVQEVCTLLCTITLETTQGRLAHCHFQIVCTFTREIRLYAAREGFASCEAW